MAMPRPFGASTLHTVSLVTVTVQISPAKQWCSMYATRTQSVPLTKVRAFHHLKSCFRASDNTRCSVCSAFSFTRALRQACDKAIYSSTAAFIRCVAKMLELHTRLSPSLVPPSSPSSSSNCPSARHPLTAGAALVSATTARSAPFPLPPSIPDAAPCPPRPKPPASP